MPIIAFHRIIKDKTNFFNDKVLYSFDDFKEVISYLRENFEIIGIKKFIERLEKGIETKNAIALTFDDGYKEIYSLVFPFLLKNNLPAVFFIPSCILEGRALSWDILSFIIKKTSKETVYIKNLAKFYIRNLDEKLKCIEKIKKFLKKKTEREKEGILKSIINQTEVKVNKKDYHSLYLTKDEIKEICKHDIFEIGSHTVNHVILSKIPEKTSIQEIKENKLFLENLIGKKVDYFAYPNGRIGDFDEKDKEILKNLDFKGAVTTEKNSAIFDKYSLPRICFERDDKIEDIFN